RDPSEAGLRAAADAAAAAARGSDGATHVAALERQTVAPPHEVGVLPESVAKARKAEVLERADDAARSVSDSIRQVSATYADSRRRGPTATPHGPPLGGAPAAPRLGRATAAAAA